MKVSRERYQHGSVRKVPRSQGFVWDFRFYITAPDGKRKLKVQAFDSVRHPTECHVRKAVEGQLSALNAGTLGGKVGATLGTIIDRYMAEDFLTLRHSTQTTNKSLIDLHIRPKWEWSAREVDLRPGHGHPSVYVLPRGWVQDQSRREQGGHARRVADPPGLPGYGEPAEVHVVYSGHLNVRQAASPTTHSRSGRSSTRSRIRPRRTKCSTQTPM